MPTGYTAAIADGISFEDYMLRCARAFGATIEMRDDPLDKPIPDEFAPNPYHLNQKKEAESHLQTLLLMGREEAQRHADEEYENAIKEHRRIIREYNELRIKYETVLEKARAWQPPTPDHVELKKFAIQQIEDSLQRDCNTKIWEEHPPLRKSGEQWRTEKIASYARDMDYHTEGWEKEQRRAKERSQWVRDLRESLKKQ